MEADGNQDYLRFLFQKKKPCQFISFFGQEWLTTLNKTVEPYFSVASFLEIE